MILKVKIFSLLLFLTLILKAQVSFYPSIDTSSQTVTILFNEKKFDKGLSLVNKLIAQNPSDGMNYFNRAVIRYYKQIDFLKKRTFNLNGNNYEIPEKEVSLYLSKNHDAFEVRNSLWYSYAYEIITDCKKAEENGYAKPELYYLLFSDSYDCDPKGADFVNACLYDSALHVSNIRYDQLKALIDTAITINPYNEKYHWSRLYLFSRYKITSWPAFNLYKDDIPILRRDCEFLIDQTKSKNKKFWAYYYLAETYKTFYTDTAKAIEYYSAAIDIDPSHNAPYLKRGALRKDFSNNYEGAIEDYNIYLAKEKDGDIFYDRAWCYFVLNRYDNALRDLNSAILQNEQQRKSILDSNENALLKLDFYKEECGSAYGLRGLVNYELKNKKAALKDFNKAIEYGSQKAFKSKAELFGDSNQNQDNIQDSQLADNSIPMIKKGDLYEIPVIINGSLKLNFIFDPGASDVSVSADVALTLIRTGTVTNKDFIGTATYRFADGSTAKSKIFILRELQIGNKSINNVRASISNSLEAPLLLGQSLLNKFGKVTIDYKNEVIRFEDY